VCKAVAYLAGVPQHCIRCGCKNSKAIKKACSFEQADLAGKYTRYQEFGSIALSWWFVYIRN